MKGRECSRNYRKGGGNEIKDAVPVEVGRGGGGRNAVRATVFLQLPVRGGGNELRGAVKVNTLSEGTRCLV